MDMQITNRTLADNVAKEPFWKRLKNNSKL